MPGITSAAYGMYPHNIELHEVVHTLNEAGFYNENICMMVSPQHPIATVVREAGSSSSTANGVTEEIIGWLARFGAVVIPTVGFFIRSHAFFQAFVGMNDSPALSTRARSLVGLGFSDTDAERLELQLREVGALVYVTCPEGGQAACAAELLRQTGAKGSTSVERRIAAGAAA